LKDLLEDKDNKEMLMEAAQAMAMKGSSHIYECRYF
jgi:hypothetical protein